MTPSTTPELHATRLNLQQKPNIVVKSRRMLGKISDFNDK